MYAADPTAPDLWDGPSLAGASGEPASTNEEAFALGPVPPAEPFGHRPGRSGATDGALALGSSADATPPAPARQTIAAAIRTAQEPFTTRLLST